jgi:hypothetical protein
MCLLNLGVLMLLLLLLCGCCCRDYDAMCHDYYTLQFMDPSIDTAPIAPALQVGRSSRRWWQLLFWCMLSWRQLQMRYQPCRPHA